MMTFFSRITGALILTAGVGLAHGADVGAALSGNEEVPPVMTSAKGTAVITVGSDMSIRGKVTTSGIVGTMAHVHLGAAGENGPALITLMKGAENEWMIPVGTKLSAEQYVAYKADKLYVNVHSEAHAGGEIRVQLKP